MIMNEALHPSLLATVVRCIVRFFEYCTPAVRIRAVTAILFAVDLPRYTCWLLQRKHHNFEFAPECEVAPQFGWCAHNNNTQRACVIHKNHFEFYERSSRCLCVEGGRRSQTLIKPNQKCHPIWIYLLRSPPLLPNAWPEPNSPNHRDFIVIPTLEFKWSKISQILSHSLSN